MVFYNFSVVELFIFSRFYCEKMEKKKKKENSIDRRTHMVMYSEPRGCDCIATGFRAQPLIVQYCTAKT